MIITQVDVLSGQFGKCDSIIVTIETIVFPYFWVSERGRVYTFDIYENPSLPVRFNVFYACS